MARRSTPIGSFKQLWQRHEDLYFNIFVDALNLLQITEKQRKDEDAISEGLCPVLQQVCFDHPQKPQTPDWEKPIKPVSEDELKGGKVRKRPDFICTIVNTFAQSPEMHEISLHIECKRLGKTRKSWNLNKNYVENGILRFDCLSHEYGKRAPSGIMIGYIVDSPPQDILKKVNTYTKELKIKLSFKFVSKVEICESSLLREYVNPENFKLIHIWAEL